MSCQSTDNIAKRSITGDAKTHKAADHRQAHRRKYGNKREEQLREEATILAIYDSTDLVAR